MAAAKVNSGEEGFPNKFSEKPIFRYTDPARTMLPQRFGNWESGRARVPSSRRNCIDNISGNHVLYRVSLADSCEVLCHGRAI